MLAAAIEPIIAAALNYCKGAVGRLPIPLKTFLGVTASRRRRSFTVDSRSVDEASGLSVGFFGSSFFDSSMPSRMLEQLAQILGFRDRASPRPAIGSPQQMQIRGFIPFPRSR
jgi:hypothetical protein